MVGPRPQSLIDALPRPYLYSTCSPGSRCSCPGISFPFAFRRNGPRLSSLLTLLCFPLTTIFVLFPPQSLSRIYSPPLLTVKSHQHPAYLSPSPAPYRLARYVLSIFPRVFPSTSACLSMFILQPPSSCNTHIPIECLLKLPFAALQDILLSPVRVPLPHTSAPDLPHF